MGYKKKYKDLVKAIKELQEANPSDERIQNWVNENVPKLRESEDERIREQVIYAIDQLHVCECTKDKLRAWLEKQKKVEIDDNDLATLENWESIVRENKDKWQLNDWFIEATSMLINKVKNIDIIKNVGHPHLADWLEKQDKHPENYNEAEKEKYDFVSGQFIECRKSFNEFKEDNSYWLEYVGNDTYIGRSDNILNKKFHITPGQLYRLFTQQHCPKEDNANEETNAPAGYGKYVDECLNEAATHFYSEGEDKYSVADLFYAGVRCGKSWLEKQGQTFTKKDVDDAYLRGVCDTKHELEKQDEQKGYTFKSLPRLLDMIEPTSRAKAYCQKLIDTLVKEGYPTDAKIVKECLKKMNGEDIPMAIMDEKQGKHLENYDKDMLGAIEYCKKNNRPLEEEHIDWLERQGEKDKKEINNFEVIPGLYKCVRRMFDGTPDGKLLFEIGNVYKCLSKHDRAEFEVSYGHSIYLEDPVICKHFIPFENQGEQNPYSGVSFEYNGHTWGMCARDGGVEILMDSELKAFVSLDKSFVYPNRPQKILVPQSVHEAVKEEKTDNADKVEPKFKVGNWYQCTKDFFGKGVTFDKNTAYYCAIEGCLQDEYGCHIAIVKDLYDNFKLWTIQDAKDGDVLTNGKMIVIFKHFEDPSYRQHIVAYIGLDNSGNIQITDDTWYLGIDKSKPATKEQRDTLFKAMDDAGFTFDFNKKEVNLSEKAYKRMFENCVSSPQDTTNEEVNKTYIEESKSFWSEEDEKMVESIITDIKYCKKAYNNYSFHENEIDWLKSLKERIGNFDDGYKVGFSAAKHNQWKPSDKQMERLKGIINSLPHQEVLYSLYQDLKKLREE